MNEWKVRLLQGYRHCYLTQNSQEPWYIENLEGKIRGGFRHDEADIGLTVCDKEGKKTEIYGCFRYFRRKAAQTRALRISGQLQDEQEFQVTEELWESLQKSLRSLRDVHVKPKEQTHIYYGETRIVQVTEFLNQEREYWTCAFLDLYLQNQGFIDRFDQLRKQSESVFEDAENWKRYRSARNTRKLLGQEAGYNNIQEQAARFFHWHCRFTHPFFKRPEDYLYFLLGLYHKGFGEGERQEVHRTLLTFREEQRTLEQCTKDWNAQVEKLSFFLPEDKVQMPKNYLIFAKRMTREMLEATYSAFEEQKDVLKSPERITEELWKLGFLVLRRKRKPSFARASFALIRIKGLPEAYQKSLFPEVNPTEPLEDENDYLVFKRAEEEEREAEERESNPDQTVLWTKRDKRYY